MTEHDHYCIFCGKHFPDTDEAHDEYGKHLEECSLEKKRKRRQQ